MKNLSIRQKMVVIYGLMTIFVLSLFFWARGVMVSINQAQDMAAGAQQISLFTWLFPGFCVVCVGITLVVGRAITKQVAYPARALAKAANQIARGDVEVALDHRSGDEMGILTEEFRQMVEAIRQQAQVLERVAQGDYTVSIPVRSEQDAVNRAIADLLENNNRLVAEIRAAAQQVNGGAQQIAQSAQVLSSGSSQQAASVQEFSATLEGVRQQSSGNADAARQALEVSSQSGERMREGMLSMEQVTEAMKAIDESSQAISGVIKVINDIAFQTNILALNAAVEAARAGQHGKGFAVVADEVRSLAGKSADAAKETEALIEGSRARVQQGGEIVQRTGESLKTVSELSAETFALMEAIAAASAAQDQSISELNTGIGQISGVVQANSATAEESAASAEELSAQSELLTKTVSRFRLREEGAAPLGLPGRR